MGKKVILCILDGFGVGEKSYEFNAVFRSNTQNFQRFLQEYPNAMLETSGEAVGLPEGQMGNSEVGHMAIGSGRVMYQDLPRINKEILNGKLEKKLANLEINNTVHLVGLCSNGGVHSSLEHIKYMYETLEKHGKKVILHIITDGRDVPPQEFGSTLEKFHGMTVGTVSGRFFAMDRDKKWERTAQYFEALKGNGKKYASLNEIVSYNYQNKITDEFFEPAILEGYDGIKNGETLLIANFRADRVRQLCQKALELQIFEKIICMAHYSDEISKKTTILFEKQFIENSLVDVLEKHKKKHLHIAETEKYAHVTFFFNGGKEEQGQFEERILVSSPNVKTYDLQPEMSIYELQDRLFPEIISQKYDFIVINIANGDMVGHTGNFEASKQAAEHIDLFLGNLEKYSLESGYHTIITADHGNLEEMVDVKTKEIHTQHTTLPVPVILISEDKNLKLRNGTLANVAGTILDLMEAQKPQEMEKGLII